MMRKLSKAKRAWGLVYAVCKTCGDVFEDDLFVCGNAYCPNDTGDEYHVLVRGLSKEKAAELSHLVLVAAAQKK
jgi:hypothetical protein